MCDDNNDNVPLPMPQGVVVVPPADFETFILVEFISPTTAVQVGDRVRVGNSFRRNENIPFVNPSSSTPRPSSSQAIVGSGGPSPAPRRKRGRPRKSEADDEKKAHKKSHVVKKGKNKVVQQPIPSSGADDGDNETAPAICASGSTSCAREGCVEFHCRRCRNELYCSEEHRESNVEEHQNNCKTISQLDPDLLKSHLDYSTVMSTAPKVYDVLQNFILLWPSFTVQWLPENVPDSNSIHHQLLLGTRASGEPNYLMICDVQIPQYASSEDVPSRSPHDGELRIRKRINHEGEVLRARLMPQNTNIVATKPSSCKDVLIFDCGKFPELPCDDVCTSTFRLRGHTQEGFGLAWNPRTQGKLISGSYDGLVCFYDINKPYAQMISASSTGNYHSDIVEDVDWHCFTENVAGSCGDDKAIVVWDTRSASSAQCVKNAHEGDIYSISFSPLTEHLLATGSADKSIKIWDMRNLNSAMLVLDGAHESAVLQAKWSPHDPNRLASCSQNGKAKIWDIAERSEDLKAPAFTHAGHLSQISDISWHPSHVGLMASSSEDNVLQVWRQKI